MPYDTLYQQQIIQAFNLLIDFIVIFQRAEKHMNTEWKCTQETKAAETDGLNPKIKNYLQKMSIAGYKKMSTPQQNVSFCHKNQKKSLKRKHSLKGVVFNSRVTTEPACNQYNSNYSQARTNTIHPLHEYPQSIYPPIILKEEPKKYSADHKKRPSNEIRYFPKDRESACRNSQPELKPCSSQIIVKNISSQNLNKCCILNKNQSQGTFVPRIFFKFSTNNKENDRVQSRNDSSEVSVGEFKTKSQFIDSSEMSSRTRPNILAQTTNYFDTHLQKKYIQQNNWNQTEALQQKSSSSSNNIENKIPVNIKKIKKLTKMWNPDITTIETNPLPNFQPQIQKQSQVKDSTYPNSENQNQGSQESSKYNIPQNWKFISFSPGKMSTPNKFSPHNGKSPHKRISHIKPGLKVTQSFFDEAEEYNNSDHGSEIILRGSQVIDEHGNLPIDLVSAFASK